MSQQTYELCANCHQTLNTRADDGSWVRCDRCQQTRCRSCSSDPCGHCHSKGQDSEWGMNKPTFGVSPLA